MRSKEPFFTPRRVARGLFIALAVATAVFMTYLAVVNALIRTGRLSAMLRDAEPHLIVQTGTSYSLWPGHVEARGLTIDYVDSNLHLLVEAPNGSFDVDLPALLLRRRFVARNVTGSDYVVRVRPHIEGLSEARRNALPDVEDVPRGKGPPPDPETLWTVQLDKVDAALSEIWVSEFRYQGEARVRGGFTYVPLRRVQIPPSELSLAGGTLLFGECEPVLAIASATASAELTDTKLPADVLRRIDGHATLTGDVRDVRFVGKLWPALHGIRGGAGRLEFDASAARGELAGKAKARYHAENLTIDRGDRALALSADVSLDASPEAHSFSARAVTEHAEFLLDGAPAAWLEHGEVRGHFARDLARPKLAKGSVAVERFTAKDVRLFERLQLLPREIGLSGGPVTGKLDLDASETDIDAAVEVDLERVAMRAAPFRGRAFGHAAGHWQSTRASPLEGTLKNAALGLRRVELESEDRHDQGWQLDGRVPELSLTRDPFRLKGQFAASTPDVKLPIQVAGVVPSPLDVLLPTRSVSVIGTLDLRDESQVVTVDKTSQGDLKVSGRLVAKPRGTYAAFLIEGHIVNLGVRATPEGSSIRFGASTDWLRKEVAGLPR